MIYEIHNSKGPSILADDADLTKIETNTGAFMVRIKQGIVRPPFIVSIIPTDRKETYLEQKVSIVNGVARVTSSTQTKVLKDLMAKKDFKKLSAKKITA